MDADAVELRVLGCLIEKQRTTPEQYPLTLNALRLAANQSTNRDPVVDYDEATIRSALDRLGRRGWTRLASGPGSRVAKFRHLADEALGVTSSQLALLAVLMLRGPQTVGELRTRSERLYPFPSTADVELSLDELAARELVERQTRRPGEREERWVQLLGATPSDSQIGEAAPSTLDDSRPGLEERVARIERLLEELLERIDGGEDATVMTTDHHSEYLAQTVAALTPEGRARVDELLAGLAQAAGAHVAVARFGGVLEHEADQGHTDGAAEAETGQALSGEELDRLLAGFMTIRDQEPLDDVGNWANAVIALIEDEIRRPGGPAMVPEAPLEPTAAGLVPAGEGWFVLNARDARWIRRPGRGHNLPFTGWTDEEAEAHFPQLGIALVTLGPGEPIGMYHWEADQEDFLVLAGQALLLVEGEERPLRQWDFIHCPPETRHMIVGAGQGCTVVAVGAREHQAGAWGAYTVDETALRHGVGVEEETSDSRVAYARFPKPEPVRYRDGLLPEP